MGPKRARVTPVGDDPVQWAAATETIATAAEPSASSARVGTGAAEGKAAVPTESKVVPDAKVEDGDGKEPGWVYILESADGRLSYVGWTVDRARRLRQHNGEICGGAKYTTGHGDAAGPWHFAAFIKGVGPWWTRRVALQLEKGQKLCRSSRGRRHRHTDPAGPLGLSFAGHPAISRRLSDLYRMLNRPRTWTRNSPQYSVAQGHSLRIELAQPFHTDAARNRIQSAACWSPTVHPLSL